MYNKCKLYEKEEYKTISAMLDIRFEALVNAAKIQIKAGEDPVFAACNIRRKMKNFMDSIKDYGASNTEPRIVLITLICEELDLPLNQETIDKIQ